MKESFEKPTEPVATNIQLGRAYFRCASQYSGDLRSYLRVRKAIAESSVNFVGHFTTHGSLRSCKVPGVGRKTLEILERILREGITAVSKSVVEERIIQIQSQHNSPTDSEGSNSEPPGVWDNAVRAVEDGPS
jgi:hypothetical protein